MLKNYSEHKEDTIMSYKNNAISSDDPKAIEKLTEKLQKCEESQTLMKKANAHYKKYGTVKGCEGTELYKLMSTKPGES